MTKGPHYTDKEPDNRPQSEKDAEKSTLDKVVKEERTDNATRQNPSPTPPPKR
jgi:hypothetical protein